MLRDGRDRRRVRRPGRRGRGAERRVDASPSPHGRPFVTWKYAATLDGLSAAPDGTSQWITSEEARRDVHVFRAEADAVMAGTGTVLADDPRLTVRDDDDLPLPYEQQPLRVVVGETPIPDYYRVHDRRRARPCSCRRRDPAAVLAPLAEREIRHVWLEGGPRLAGAFWNAGLIDRVIGYIAPAMLGSGRAAPGGGGHDAGRPAPHRHRRPAPDRPRHPHHRHAARADRGGALMFTGLVEEKGTVTALEQLGDAVRLTIRGPVVTSDAAHGDSISVNGVLPHRRRARRRHLLGRRHGRVARPHVAGRPRRGFRGQPRAGDGGRRPHGRPHRAGPRRRHRRACSTARPASTGTSCGSRCPADLARYLVEKGSITVDGVSLTVVEVADDDGVVLGVAHPHHARRHHARQPRARRPGQPRGRRPRQVRGAAARRSGRETGHDGPARQHRTRHRRHPRGKAVVVVDDEDRENEGDLIFAASKATPQLMAFLVRHSSGYVCAPITGDTLDRLGIPLMTPHNRERMRTAYTISIDARDGITTGISAADRARTVPGARRLRDRAVRARPARPRAAAAGRGGRRARPRRAHRGGGRPDAAGRAHRRPASSARSCTTTAR